MRTLYSFVTLFSLGLVIFIVSRMGTEPDPPEVVLYRQECGSCHWSLRPELLPASSWKKIMGNLEDHFGYDAVLEEEEHQVVVDYLTQNAYKGSVDVKPIPIRATQMPHIRRAHPRIKPWLNPKIHFVNCNACHVRADEGAFKQVAFQRVDRLKAGAKTNVITKE